MYEKELQALKRAGRLRERQLYDASLVDLASNDYLGLAHKHKQLQKACDLVAGYSTHAPKASMLINGYHEIHQQFEETLAMLNGFEAGICVGSGFLANMGMIEALVRKHDCLFVDEEYHASGMMATGLLGGRVVKFRHNDPEDLRRKLQASDAKRKIVAVEGVYSMSGELCDRAIFEVCDEAEALLIVDEAHSSGVVGKRLLGIFEHYGIIPHARHIKMGTLGKAYGSYGAYILASSQIISFLQNRAKPIIYSTAPSVIDTALALVNLRTIAHNSAKFVKKREQRLALVEKILGIKSESLIIPIPVKSNEDALAKQALLKEHGYLVGAIRQPTVAEPILRVIPRIGVSKGALKEALRVISNKVIE